MTHYEYLYLLSRAELIDKLRKETPGFVGSRAYQDLTDSVGALIELEDDRALLFVRLNPGVPAERGVACAKLVFGDTYQVAPPLERDDGCVHLAYSGPRPTNPLAKSK